MKLIKSMKHILIYEVLDMKPKLNKQTCLLQIEGINEQITHLTQKFKSATTKTVKSKCIAELRDLKDRKTTLYRRWMAQVPTTSYKFVHKKTGASYTSAKLADRSNFSELNIRVQKRRTDNRVIKIKYIKVYNLSTGGISRRLGLTHEKPNEIYNLFIHKKIKDLDLPKKPIDKSRYLGLEFEFTCKATREQLGLELFNAGLINFCELKTDGSLRPKDGEFGYEIAMLVKESTYLTILKKICDVLEKLNAQTEDRRCGFHVHIDCRSRKKELVYHNLVSCQNLLMKLIPSERRNGEFCGRVVSKRFPTNFTGDRHERYKTINAASFYRHGTIEVRMHEGSVSYTDIKNWVNLLIKIANLKKPLPKSVSSVGMLKKIIKVNEQMNIHIRDRINKWNILAPARVGRQRPPTGIGATIAHTTLNLNDTPQATRELVDINLNQFIRATDEEFRNRFLGATMAPPNTNMVTTQIDHDGRTITWDLTDEN